MDIWIAKPFGCHCMSGNLNKIPYRVTETPHCHIDRPILVVQNELSLNDMYTEEACGH